MSISIEEKNILLEIAKNGGTLSAIYFNEDKRKHLQLLANKNYLIARPPVLSGSYDYTLTMLAREVLKLHKTGQLSAEIEDQLEEKARKELLEKVQRNLELQQETELPPIIVFSIIIFSFLLLGVGISYLCSEGWEDLFLTLLKFVLAPVLIVASTILVIFLFTGWFWKKD